MSHDELGDYPCPHEDARGVAGCACKEDCIDEILSCEFVVVYRAQIKMRADYAKLRAAVLGDLPPEVAAYVYRDASTLYAERGNAEAERRFNALADVVGGLT